MNIILSTKKKNTRDKPEFMPQTGFCCKEGRENAIATVSTMLSSSRRGESVHRRPVFRQQPVTSLYTFDHMSPPVAPSLHELVRTGAIRYFLVWHDRNIKSFYVDGNLPVSSLYEAAAVDSQIHFLEDAISGQRITCGEHLIVSVITECHSFLKVRPFNS
jgi:hypothetical protein